MGSRPTAPQSASTKTYSTVFEPLAKKTEPVWIAETHARLAQRTAGEEGPAGTGIPYGALLNRQAFALGAASEAFLDLAEHELAHTWFGQSLMPRPEAELVLGKSLSDYAVLVAAEARGGEPARRRHVALLLRYYDEARKEAVEKPLIALTPSDPWEQRVLAYNKGVLFYVALEDQFGKENVRRALAHLIRSTQGGSAGFSELRAALELETHQSLAEFFRTWLFTIGLPDAFRTRYKERVKPTE